MGYNKKSRRVISGFFEILLCDWVTVLQQSAQYLS
jgi:hypothetical protein